MKLLLLLTSCILLNAFYFTVKAQPGSHADDLIVKKCEDFTITGKGDNPAWGNTEWTIMKKLDAGGTDYETKFKIMYSPTGVYVVFSGKDSKITTSYQNDFEDLFKGDVFEVFFHTDVQLPLYFEYEINQLNKELVLIIPNLNGKINGWLPWHYENERRTKKMVVVAGGKAEVNGNIQSWSAEIFFPYRLFNPLGNVPPKSGTVWNANFYRLDYDNGSTIKYAWGPVERSFHEFKRFRPIRFE